MKSETTAAPVVQALNLEQALAGETCPYCGQPRKNLLDHIDTCQEAIANKELEKNTPRSQWAMHQTCGKVFVLSYQQGLCVVEGDTGRFVVPLNSLKFGGLSRLIDSIEEAELAPDEIERLINILRIKAKGTIKIPLYPELWPGCRVEAQLGEHVRTLKVKTKRGGCYLAEIEGRGTSVNIAPKDILRIV